MIDMSARHDLLKEYFLFSVFPFYNVKGKKLDQGIHALTGVKGKVLLDSGGFQLYKSNSVLNYQDTLKLYERAQLTNDDFGISLDFVPLPDESMDVRMKKIQQSNETFKLMREDSSVGKRIVPVIHGWTEKELEESFKQIEGDVEFLSYGSCFPMITSYHNSGQIPDSIKTMIIENFHLFFKMLKAKKLDGMRLHILGANGQNSSHLCWYSGASQTDSGSWRLKAAYGKIALPEIAEIKMSDRESSFGANKYNNAYDPLLLACECPICKGLSLDERKNVLRNSFTARATHNAFVFIEERNMAREKIGTPNYRQYLEKRFKGSWWLKFLNKMDATNNTKSLDQFFRQTTK
jgi:queuine/archaeosine tRNA-ribosyltransferase